MGRKWEVESPSLRWFVQVTPRLHGCSVTCLNHQLFRKSRLSSVFFILRHDEDVLGGIEGRGNRGGELVWCSGGVITQCGAEGWEANGYFILSIGVCKWKCQSGWKTNESDRRDATSLAKCLINCRCLFGALIFFVVIFWLFSPPGLAVCG